MALGDSAAQSIGASSPELGYVGLLAERMRARICQPVLVINHRHAKRLAITAQRTVLLARLSAA